MGYSWAPTSSALQKVCSSRDASNSMPFEPTTNGSLRPLPSFLVHCVRRRPIFASATLAAAAGLKTQAYRNVDASSRPAERRLGRLSRLCCDFMTAGPRLGVLGTTPRTITGASITQRSVMRTTVWRQKSSGCRQSLSGCARVDLKHVMML